MPISIKTTEPKADVPFAKSPEFQKLQDAINQAKEALDDVSRQIVAVESKLNPQPSGKPGEDPMSQATTQPDRKPGQPKSPPGPMEPHPGYPSSYNPTTQTPQAAQDAMGAPPTNREEALGSPYRPNGRPGNFEEAIEDMRRIAGLR